MSTFLVETTVRPRFEVVELESVRAHELEKFFLLELEDWRDRLYWDVSSAVAAMRRALDRRGVHGKAIRCGSTVAAYAYFIIEGSRAVVTGLSIAPEWRGTDVGRVLVRAILSDLASRGLSRIESQFVSFDASWLVPCFEEAGFRSYWRDFRRLSLRRPRSLPQATPEIDIQPWKGWNLTEASILMQSAHEGGVDAEMNEMYRTSEGCRALLSNVVRHRGCGSAIPEASALARCSTGRRAVAFAVVTETSSTHAHLAQLAVSPVLQGRGVGQRLLLHSVDRLLDLGFETLSLMVSRENRRAVHLYASMGFEPVLRFPVFSRVL